MSFKKILAVVMASAMAIGTFAASALTLDVAEAVDGTAGEVAVLAATTADVAVGEGQTYTALKDALANATDTDNDGVVTVGVYGKVEIGATFQLNVAAETVNIVGMDDAAEIYVTAKPADNGIVYVANNAIETLNFKDITLSRPNGEWRGNEGHHNRFFTVWDSDGSTDLIAYTNCVFPNGSGNNQYGKTTYTDCTFNNDTYYALWIYGSGSATSVVVTGGTFVADRGVKIYSEDAAAVVDTTITGATFDIESKPAIVSSIAGTVTIENVNATACEYGLLASEPKDGRTDLAMAVVTVDDEAPAYVAKVGNMLCTDVDYAEAESSDTKPVEVPVAKIGNAYYASLQTAINAAEADDVIVLVADIEYDNYVYASGKTTSVNIPAGKQFTLDLNGKTISGVSTSSGSFELMTICNGAVVTIDDTSAAKTGKITFEMNRATPDGWMNRAHTIFNQGTLILNGGTIENATPESQEAVSSAVDNNCSWGKLGKFVMNGGVVTSAGYYAVRTDINTHNTTATSNLKAETIFNGGTVYGFYLMDRGNDYTQWPGNNIEFSVGDDAVIEPANYSSANGTAIRLRYGNRSDVAVEVSEDAVVNGKITGAAAKVGGTYYKTFEAAVAAAIANDTITLMSDVAFASREASLEPKVDNLVYDLNGYTMTLSGDHVFSKNVTFKNGTIAISDQLVGTGVFWVWNADNTLTFDNVAIENAGDSINACSIFATSSGAPEFVLKNCTINLKNNTFNPDDGANLFYFNNNATNVKIEKTTIAIDRFARGLQYGTYDIDDSEITMTNMNGNAIRRADAVITNSTFIAENTENGMKLDGDNDVVIDGDSYVRLLGATDFDIVVSANSTVAVNDDAVLYADKGNIADASTVTGNVVVLADIIAVDFVQVDGDAEGYDLYNINLVGANGEVINRLNSADLTFVLDATPVTGAAVNYEIIPVKNVTVTPDTTTPDEDRFMFNFNGKDAVADTENTITIAQVKISGYGTYTFSVDTAANATNVVHATTISDNIVDTFVPDGAAGKGTLNLDDATTGEVTIAVPVRTLTVKVAFPNSVVDNAAAYQDMKVEITGNIDGVHQTVKYDLGGNMKADGTYVVEETRLVLNETYNVVVSGAGYRTARYTVTMTKAKTLNFWNNVKDNAVEVEEGKASSAAAKNFLAGDIVGDNQINIYDLSAVVSYFATEITDEADYDKYVKYDLNRDGKIDSKDVAYVLVSWGA